MSRIILFLILSFSFSYSFGVSSKEILIKRRTLKSLTTVEDFFYTRGYRQATRATKLRVLYSRRSPLKFKTELTSFMKNIRRNKRFKSKVKAFVMGEYGKVLSMLNYNSKVMPKGMKKTFRKSIVRSLNKSKKVPTVIVSAHTNRDISSSSYETLSYVMGASLVFMFGLLFAFIKNTKLLKNKMIKLVQESTNHDEKMTHDQLNSFATMMTLSTKMSKYNHMVMYEPTGKILKISENTKSIFDDEVKVGDNWPDFLKENFFKVGEDSGEFFMSSFDTTKYFMMNTNSVRSINANFCQLIEFDKNKLLQIRDFADENHCETPFGLLDVLENSFANILSFKNSRLMQLIEFDLTGADTCFQKEESVKTLFNSLAKLLESAGPSLGDESVMVNVSTINEKHIVNIEIPSFRFGSNNTSEMTQDPLNQKLDKLRESLELIGGKVVVKNLIKEKESRGIVQIIFRQYPKRKIGFVRNDLSENFNEA